MSTLTAPESGIRCPGCRCVVEAGEACGERLEGMLGADVLVELTCVRCGDGAEACEAARCGSNRRSVALRDAKTLEGAQIDANKGDA